MRETKTNNETPILCDAQLLSIQEIASDILYFILDAPAIAQCARPGQFIMLKVPSKGTDPLLRRPFSLCFVDNPRIHLLIQMRGTGTRILQTCAAGQIISIIGPLGNGFTVPESLSEAIIVAGGIGCAPLMYLANFIHKNRPGCTVRFFHGAVTKLYTKMFTHFNFLPSEPIVATEDGSDGYKGLVTELISSWLDSGHIKKHSGISMYGCGPNPMLSVLAGKAKVKKIACQVSLEAMMACGVGACMGCIIRGSSGDYKRVCADGPVFDGTDIFWHTS